MVRFKIAAMLAEQCDFFYVFLPAAITGDDQHYHGTNEQVNKYCVNYCKGAMIYEGKIVKSPQVIGK